MQAPPFLRGHDRSRSSILLRHNTACGSCASGKEAESASYSKICFFFDPFLKKYLPFSPFADTLNYIYAKKARRAGKDINYE